MLKFYIHISSHMFINNIDWKILYIDRNTTYHTFFRLAIKYIKHLQYLLSFPPNQPIPQHIVAFDPVHPAWGKSASVSINEHTAPMIVHVLNRRGRNNRELEDGEIIINNPNNGTRSSRRVISQPIITSYDEPDKSRTSWNEAFITRGNYSWIELYFIMSYLIKRLVSCLLRFTRNEIS